MSRKEYYSEDQYEEEQLEGADEAQSFDSEDDFYDEVAENDLKYVQELLMILRAEINNGRSVPFGGSNRVVDTKKCLEIINDLEKSMPDAVKRGAWVYDQKDEMLRRAQDETRRHIASAEISFQRDWEKRNARLAQEEENAKSRAAKIISDAERRANDMVRQGVIASRVEEEVRSIRANAQAQAHETQIRVEDECYKRLEALGGTFTKMLKEINRMRAEFDNE